MRNGDPQKLTDLPGTKWLVTPKTQLSKDPESRACLRHTCHLAGPLDSEGAEGVCVLLDFPAKSGGFQIHDLTDTTALRGQEGQVGCALYSSTSTQNALWWGPTQTVQFPASCGPGKAAPRPGLFHYYPNFWSWINDFTLLSMFFSFCKMIIFA